MPSGVSIPRRIKAAVPSAKSSAPVQGSGRPHHLSKATTDQPQVYLANGMTLSQPAGLRPLPGQVGIACLGSSDGFQTLPAVQEFPVVALNSDSTHESTTFAGYFDDTFEQPSMESTSRHRRRRLNQTRRWIQEVIPKLILPYMRLVSTTESLRCDIECNEVHSCTCNGDFQRVISISVVRFHVIESTRLSICRCHPASRQLICMGLFPCAPILPSLAIDLRVLDFASRLFLNISPNATAWSKTVEEFLEAQGYKLAAKNSLRKRFSEALKWYNTLLDHTDRHVRNVLYHTRRLSVLYNDGFKVMTEEIQPASPPHPSPSPVSTTPLVDSEGVNSQNDSDTAAQPVPLPNSSKRRLQPEKEDSTVENSPNPFPSPPPRDRPSDYLRSRCALCFGGVFPRPIECAGPDVIICVDACFKQKRNKGEKEAAFQHPNTLFVPEESIRCMDEYVESLRPSQHPKRSKRPRHEHEEERPQDSSEEDGYNGPLRVPQSVLATCQESFTAADENRQKASTQFFSETALMALLCRHDRVLWIASMSSAGEKQHYALALIETFFQNVPQSVTVGLMYDVGCQLHQSCVKWGFLSQYLDRMTFAVSVFHAFGHQWACQLVYHPRKCQGFGLSDGEGCERLWKSIQNLIPYLRVCGHYQRLYTLNRQILRSEKEAQQRLGEWLLRRSRHTHQKKIDAAGKIKESGRTIDFSEAEWRKQVEAQTRPLPRQSKSKGKDAVERAVQLRKSRETLLKQIRQLEDIITDEYSDSYMIANAELELPQVRERLGKVTIQTRKAEEALGVSEKQRLHQLINNPFIAARMNARALKIRLREKIRARKFELDRLERSFRHQVNERKIDEHTESAVRRRDPGIQKLARDYNKLCQQMQKLKSQGKAPRGVVCPDPIELSGIFALDVDDDIWQDIGLDETLDDSALNLTPPLWLADDKVRSGIKAVLEFQRCQEEENRLKWECQSLKNWFSEEWRVVKSAMDATDDAGLSYQLVLRKKELVNLLMGWKKPLQAVSGMEFVFDDWGPSHDDFIHARTFAITASFAQPEQGMDSDSEEDVDVFDEVIPDAELFVTLDAVDMVDSIRHREQTI